MKKNSFFQFFKIVFFLFFSFFLYSESGLSQGERRGLNYLENLTFEIARYNKTGVSSMDEALKFSDISKTASLFFLRHKFNPDNRKIVYTVEYYFPEKTGIIDSSFSKLNLLRSYDDFWIDSFLANMNFSLSDELTDVTDGTKILEMLENSDNRGIDLPDTGKEEKNIPQEYSYTKNDGHLRKFLYDGEQFVVWTDADNTVITNYYGDKIIRKIFDSSLKLSKKEEFKTESKAKNIKKISSTEYEYNEDSVYPFKSIENLFQDKKIFEAHYDDEGRVIFFLESHYSENNENVLNDKKILKVYDSEGRIEGEETVLFSYKTNSFGKTVCTESSLKNIYTYAKVNEGLTDSPDVAYFENGILHLERKFLDKNSYSERLYFENSISVEVWYEDGLKKTEVIYLNGLEQRRRNFEY